MFIISNAVIEMREGDIYKYEMAKEGSRLEVTRVLRHGVPTNYGFVPATLCEDGDPLDIFVCSDQLLERNCQVAARVIGGFSCEDNGEKDDKLVAVLALESITDAEQKERMDKIRTYLSTYKKGFKVLNEVGPDGACIIYGQAKNLYDYDLKQFAEELPDDDAT